MDNKPKKYKGKICSPPSRHLGKKKNTHDWCGGKNGLSHDWKWMEDSRDDVFGLPTRQYEKCQRCGKRQWGGREINYPFGVIFKSARQTMGITQEQVALKLGIPQSLVSSVEAAKNSPSVDTVFRYCGALGIHVGIEISPEPRRWNKAIKVSPERL